MRLGAPGIPWWRPIGAPAGSTLLAPSDSSWLLRPRGSQEETGARRNKEESGGTRRSQEEARKSQEEPGRARKSQEEPGRTRRSQEEPGGAKDDPGRARKSQQKQGGVRRSHHLRKLIWILSSSTWLLLAPYSPSSSPGSSWLLALLGSYLA